MIKCLFFDRDGVINQRIVGGYVKSESEFILNKEILPLLNYCDTHNILKIIITNQQGIGKGLMSENDLTKVHNFMNKLLINNKIKKFDDIFYASELSSEIPNRRKPSPKMLLEAMEKHALKDNECLLIGDSITDIQAAKNANIKSIFYNEENYNIADISSKNINQIINFIDTIHTNFTQM